MSFGFLSRFVQDTTGWTDDLTGAWQHCRRAQPMSEKGLGCVKTSRRLMAISA